MQYLGDICIMVISNYALKGFHHDVQILTLSLQRIRAAPNLYNKGGVDLGPS